MLERVEGSFYFLSRHQEDYFKQALIFADFKRQLLNEGDDLSDSLKQVYANFDRSVSQFFGVEDPQLIDFILCMSDGLIWQQIYGLGHGDYEGNAKLMTKMITAYLNSVDRKLLSVDERMRVSADAFGQTAIASDRGTISTS
jgi:hypothetical protein